MIEWVRVAGYKCLLDVEVEAGPFNVLIGRNDSGKSSFLEALHELSYWAHGHSRYFAERAKQGQESSGLTLRVQASRFLAGGKFDGSGWESQIGAVRWPKGAPPWERMSTHEEAAPMRAAIRTTQPLSIDPPRIADVSQRGTGDLAELIESRGRGTAAHFASLALQDRERFDKAEATLRDATDGRYRNLLIKEAGNDYKLYYRLHDGTVIPASDASYGVLLYTCFLAIVHREDVPAALLIEHPENGIHPLWLREIVELLRSLTGRGTQIFLTTYSPDLVSWCDPEEVLVFWRSAADSGTQIHKLPADFNERIKAEESMGEIWAARGEEGLLAVLGDSKVAEPRSAP